MSRHRRRGRSWRKAQVPECEFAGSVVEPAPRAWGCGAGDAVAMRPHTIGIESSNAWTSATVQLSSSTVTQARASSSRGRARGAAATASDGTSWRGRPAAAPLLSLRVSIASTLTVGAVHRVCVCPRRGNNADILCRRHRTALVATGAKNSCLRSCIMQLRDLLHTFIWRHTR